MIFSGVNSVYREISVSGISHQFLPLKNKVAFIGPLSIHFVVAGSIKGYTGGRLFEIRRNHFLVVNTCNEVILASGFGEESEFISIYMHDEDVRERLDDAQVRPDFQFFEGQFHANNNYLGRLLRELTNKVRSDDHYKQEQMINQIIDGLISDQKEAWKKIGSIQASKNATREEVFRSLLKAELYIEDNLNRKIQLDDICKFAGMSRFHFLRKFHEAYGVSPHQYIIRRKIQRSCQLINNKEISLSEVAHLAGFGDIHIFSKVFRRVMGFPPSQLRKAG